MNDSRRCPTFFVWMRHGTGDGGPYHFCCLGQNWFSKDSRTGCPISERFDRRTYDVGRLLTSLLLAYSRWNVLIHFMDLLCLSIKLKGVSVGSKGFD